MIDLIAMRVGLCVLLGRFVSTENVDSLVLAGSPNVTALASIRRPIATTVVVVGSPVHPDKFVSTAPAHSVAKQGSPIVAGPV